MKKLFLIFAVLFASCFEVQVKPREVNAQSFADGRTYYGYKTTIIEGMKYIYISIIIGIWLVIQWLSHDSYWFNFILNLSCMIAMTGSIFHHYEKSKPKHFTREEYKEAMRNAIEKTNISILNEYEK